MIQRSLVWALLEFNGREIEPVMKIASPVFSQRSELQGEPSHPARSPAQLIDYIFFSDDFELISPHVFDNSTTSDHHPVRSRLRLA
jgi:endonuclease/exonuclease/phosphatase family metal-dependent hydrolase